MVISRLKSSGNNRNNACLYLIFGDSFSTSEYRNICKCSPCPPLWYTIHDGGGFVAGEAQVYEPFLIQPLRRFFQQLDLLLVVFNQNII